MGKSRAEDLRLFVKLSIGVYDLAHTPPVQSIYRQVVPDIPPETGEDDYPDTRPAQLRMGIDIKYIVTDFFQYLSDNHGTRRAERFLDYLMEGYIRNISHEHREQIKEDRKMLHRLFGIGKYVVPSE